MSTEWFKWNKIRSSYAFFLITQLIAGILILTSAILYVKSNYMYVATFHFFVVLVIILRTYFVTKDWKKNNVHEKFTIKIHIPDKCPLRDYKDE